MIASPLPPSGWLPFSVLCDEAPPAAARPFSVREIPVDAPAFQCGFTGRLEHWREYFTAAAPDPKADAARLFHLLETAGHCLAVVRFIEIELPGTGGRRAGMWRLPDGEILFGAAPLSDRGYWRQLTAFARRRVQCGQTNCRLVVFAPDEDHGEAAGAVSAPAAEVSGEFLEILPLNRAARGTLLAAAEVLREAARAGGPGAAAAFTALAARTGFLWSRLTRPCRSAAVSVSTARSSAP